MSGGAGAALGGAAHWGLNAFGRGQATLGWPDAGAIKEEKMRKAFFAGLMAALVLFGSVGVSQAVPLIDTTGSWGDSYSIGNFGVPNTATYGQTFTVTGAETSLNSFTFYVDDRTEPDAVNFQAYVYAWDGDSITGDALYASGAMSTTNNGGNDGYEPIQVNTGGISLASGNQYIAFLSASNLFESGNASSTWRAVTDDVYAGGGFFFFNNGRDFSLLTSPWDAYLSDWDLVFKMEFSEPSGGDPVPEPATMLLMGSGLAGLAMRRFRKKN